MNKDMAHTHTHIHTMGHYLTIKKNEIMPSVLTWMGLEIIGQSKPETERQYHMILLICGIFQKGYNRTYLADRTRPRDMEGKFMVTRREREEEEQFGI